MIDTSRQTRSLGPLSSLRWWRMTLKELREILRDRRTIITLVGMPILIYPLLGVTFQRLLAFQVVNQMKTVYRIACATPEDSRILNNLLFQAEQLTVSAANGSKRPPAGTPDDPIWETYENDNVHAAVNVEKLVSEREADVGLRFQPQTDEGPWNIEITYRPSSQFSINARRAIEDRFRVINDQVTGRVLQELDPSLRMPITLKSKSVTSSDAGPSFSIATLIPLILILMTVTGAVYPAIDLTAGERERGTLEALISAPVPRHELLFAKYLAVLAVAILTAVANLASMVVTAYSNGLENLLFGSGGISLRMLLLMLSLLILFAGFFASVILILTSFARSFKEAQAYLIPVMLVSLAPGVICLMPGIEMSGWMSVTPLVNIVILSRDVFEGRAQSAWVLTTLLSTVLYSTVALSIAAKIFGTDAVLYGSEGSWSDLVQRPVRSQPTATLTQAMTCLVILVPSFLILSGLPRRLTGESAIGHVFGNALITIVLFAVLPLVMAQWSHVDWKSGFQLYPSNRACFIAAALLGLSLWPFAVELVRWHSPSIVQEEKFQELLRQITARLDAIPLPAKLLALALIPAVCEELFFRGYLQTSLRTGMSTPLAIALSSCLFGVFHVIATMSFERFLPTFVLGLVLGWICSRSGSVLPGMLLHTVHNSLILLMQTFMKQLSWLGLGTESERHLPILWIIAASAIVIVAVGILIQGTSRPRPPEVEITHGDATNFSV